MHLGGARVGGLSPVMWEQYAPTLHHLSGVGLSTVAYCSLRGSPLKVELTLQAARAGELPADGVDGGAVTLPRLVSSASRYEVPPAYVQPLRPAGGDGQSIRPTVAGVATLVGLSSWIIGDLLN